MNEFHHLIIEPLNPVHQRSGFSCGNDALDHYIKKQATQDIKRKISRVFIARLVKDPAQIIGYYTLSALSINLEQLPESLIRKLPKHPIPAALIGRLAVSCHAQGQGIGKILLADAIKRTLGVSEELAIYAMVVDAIDQQAACFYQQYGFIALQSNQCRLFLPIKSL